MHKKYCKIGKLKENIESDIPNKGLKDLTRPSFEVHLFIFILTPTVHKMIYTL